MPRRPKKTPADSRAARIAAVQQQANKRRRRDVSAIWIVLGLVLVLIAGGVTWAIITRPVLNEVNRGAVTSFNHVYHRPNYDQTPPWGGDHHERWLNCGIYDEPVPDHHAVHSLEHGAVWLTYQPGLDPDGIAELERLADQPYLILSPYPDQPAPVMATAWGLQLELDEVDRDQLNLFIREYRQGPQTREPNGACTGGTSVDLLPPGLTEPSPDDDDTTSAPGDEDATSSPDDDDATSSPDDAETTSEPDDS